MKKQKKAPERRKAQRLTLPMHLSYRLKRKKTWQKNVCDNISGVGLSLSVKELLAVDDKVEVAVYLDNDPKPIKISCRVAWCVKVKKDGFKAGVEVIAVKDEMRFIEFFCGRMIDLSL